MAILTVEERLKETLQVVELQREKLKLCRSVMRDNNIGHLYPGSSVEYENDMKASMVSGGSDLAQSLYSKIAFDKVRMSEDKRIANEYVKKLLSFIESKGIAAEELQKWMNDNFEIKMLADEQENNLQTLSLEDDNGSR